MFKKISPFRPAPRFTGLSLGTCLLIWLAACGGSVDTPARVPDAGRELSAETEQSSEARTVVFLGDSLTAGYGLNPQDALPEQVARVWEAQGIDAVTINAGVSGDTTANGLSRFQWSVTDANPDLVVVALGSNDFLMGVPADVARTNLSGILEQAKAENIPAVLVGVALRGEVLPGSPEAAYEAIYPELAAEFGVPYYPSLLDGVAKEPALLQSDGLHPTKEGVTKIAPPLAAFLTPLIRGAQSP